MSKNYAMYSQLDIEANSKSYEAAHEFWSEPMEREAIAFLKLIYNKVT